MCKARPYVHWSFVLVLGAGSGLLFSTATVVPFPSTTAFQVEPTLLVLASSDLFFFPPSLSLLGPSGSKDPGIDSRGGGGHRPSRRALLYGENTQGEQLSMERVRWALLYGENMEGEHSPV